jgi:hypothetical protein
MESDAMNHCDGWGRPKHETENKVSEVKVGDRTLLLCLDCQRDVWRDFEQKCEENGKPIREVLVDFPI